jgi:hypothetical protein
MGFAIILWRWLFAAAACLIVVVGAFRVVHGLRAPLWIGIVLALPCLLWAADSLMKLTSGELTLVTWMTMSGRANYLAGLAAGAAALRLAETMSRPHVAFRIGYGLLATSALVAGIGWTAHLMGWSFIRNPLYATSVRPVHLAAMFVEYAAFIGTAVLVTMRRDLETWTGAVIALVGVYMLYETMSGMFAIGFRGDMAFWLQPVVLLFGSAAVWRIGSLLHAQNVSQRYAQG